MPTDSNTPKTIVLSGADVHVVSEEKLAGGAITPGHLVGRNASNAVVVHASAGGNAEKMFALEDALQGNTIDDAYASGDRVSLAICSPGTVVYAYLAVGESCDPSDFLTSNGDGTLKVATSTDARIAVPEETLDNSETADTAAARLKVRVI
ncbi:MAG: hypothetical protein Unbinned3891contig1000_79 [Prokaryotic dsDNA virus sp.]|nr:MAG: hypothetical protein Unbinned3891contig1000_79 [Prokaryotic dsDNA virus sp.]|tara:strand:- start:46793 stop:47245 length:453 start_codon:yes stop_codon:yes gene_type:complete